MDVSHVYQAQVENREDCKLSGGRPPLLAEEFDKFIKCRKSEGQCCAQLQLGMQKTAHMNFEQRGKMPLHEKNPYNDTQINEITRMIHVVAIDFLKRLRIV